MAANLSLIILLFEMVLYLTTVTSVDLPDFESIAKEVKIAIKKMDLPKRMKDAISDDYIDVGGYSNSFIELLDSYWTMSRSPVHFNEGEKLLLTLSSTEDPIEYKVGTQLKYYRKMQEVQCTDYFILHYNLFDANWNIQHIIKHVYNMIKMAYLGNFVIFEWLLKLHINLLTPSGWNDEAWITQFMREGLYDLEQYKKTLDELVIMCVKHNYLENDNSKGFFNKILEHDNFNTQLHLHFNTNSSPLPFSFDYLYLSNIRQWEQRIVPITSAATGWNMLNDVFQHLIVNINEQLSSVEDWKRDPLKNIVFQEYFLNIVILKLYCFVKIVLVAYQKMDVSNYKNRLHIFNRWIQIFANQKVDVSNYKYRLEIFYRLDYFMSLISDIVDFINIEYTILIEVLTVHSTYKKGEPNYEKNEKLLKIITNEITKIMKTMKIPFYTKLACLTNDDLKTELAFNIYLGNLEKAFLEFGNFVRTTLDGFSLDVLLFFVDGIHNTELAVFP